MKNHYIIFILFGCFFVSCNLEPKNNVSTEQTEKINKLEDENTYLKQVNEEKDIAINNFMGTINEISKNIDLIKQKEDIISLNSLHENMDANTVEQISQDILFITELMDKNRQTIENLNNELANSTIYSEELQNTLNNFNSLITNQEKKIDSLQFQLIKYHSDFEQLQIRADSLKQVAIVAQEEAMMHKEELQTAYYVTGYSTELRDKNIIRKKGGMFGIGSVEVLIEDFNKPAFEKINIMDTQSITLNCHSAELLSKHPSYSYKFDGPPNFTYHLVITRPKEFWSTSKYLVILKK
jgi:hypothetical protein